MCDIGINMKHIAVQRLPTIPLWCLKSRTFNFDLQLLGQKSVVALHIFISKYNELVSEYKNYMHIFTDGSKYDTKAAAVCENNICASRLPDNSSIFSAEIHTINLALNLIKDHNGNKFIIFSDSLSSQTALTAAPGNILVPHYDFRQHLHQYFKSKWQTVWDSQIHNKLHKIKPNIGITFFRSQLDRRKEHILHRLRIGHTYLTHAFLLK